MKKISFILIAMLSAAGSIFLVSHYGDFSMTSKIALKIKEPMLIAGEQQHFSILPAGTILYFDKAWPEGHQTFHVYFHFKGEMLAEKVDAETISPLWLRTVDPEELPKLLSDYPVTKDELTKILKARKISKAELVQIIRDWPDD